MKGIGEINDLATDHERSLPNLLHLHYDFSFSLLRTDSTFCRVNFIFLKC